MAAHPVEIIYATETGTSLDVAYSIHRHLLLRSIPTRPPSSVASFDPVSLPDLVATPVVFVVSTAGNGDPPRDLRPLWDLLLRKDLPPDILDEVSFCVFGIGDSGYERFNWAGKIFRRRLLALGANELLGQTEFWADERAGGGIETTLFPFLDQLTTGLIPVYSDLIFPGPLPSNHLFPPLAQARIESSSVTSGADQIDSHAGRRAGDGDEDGWRQGTLTKFERMTEDTWEQDVRLVEIKTDEGLLYSPGSILQLLPCNSQETIDRFFALQPHLPPPSTRVTFIPPPSPADEHAPAPPSPLYHLPLSLLELVRDHLDVTSVPRRSFFQWMRCFATDEREQERLDEFLHLDDGADDLYEYIQQPRRTMLEVLADFRNVQIPLDYLPEVFGPIRRREFSIASAATVHPGTIQLCIALVRYKTLMKIPRVGLCTTWLASVPLGQSLPIRVCPGTMSPPSSPKTPVILVGPGTGVAPLRAFVEQRALEKAAATTLYFGCRSRSKDFLFQEDWERLEFQGSLRLRVAASRDQEDKVYVQHLIREDAQLVSDTLLKSNGSVFISGSSNAMPRAVKAALAFCLETAGRLSADEAKAYLDEMEVQGRLNEECWS